MARPQQGRAAPAVCATMGRMRLVRFVFVLGLAALCALPIAPAVGEGLAATTRVVRLQGLPPLDGIVGQLVGRRVVYVGEMHDRYDHHLNQLALIERLHARTPDLALGVEFFQQPFQPHLDAYIAREIDTAELLARTEYYRRWQFDFRLYAPILAYARERGIPVIALNVPSELVSKVGQSGLESLTAEERAALPQEIDRSDAAYRARLETIFRQHPGSENRDFERFVDAQLLWDEGMAARAAEYLRANPSRRMVVLAGNGHLAYGAGIPNRVERRLNLDSAIVLQSGGIELAPDLADFMLLSEERKLPPAGTLGVVLEPVDGVHIAAFAEESAARAAGLREKDQIVAVDDRPVTSIAEVKAMLWDKSPGDRVRVTVSRGFFDPSEQQFEVELRAHER